MNLPILAAEESLSTKVRNVSTNSNAKERLSDVAACFEVNQNGAVPE